MLVKSLKAFSHVIDLNDMFAILRQNSISLNPAKCAFGKKGGKFLGFMVTQKGIKANPEKIQAQINMKSPTKVKEVQSLAGRVVAINIFISKAIDKYHLFFKILKKAFEWIEECEEAFQISNDTLEQLFCSIHRRNKELNCQSTTSTELCTR